MQVKQVTLGKYEGAYRVAAVSGLLTTVAAGTATAGHLFAMRWAPATQPYAEANIKVCAIQRIVAKWRTITGFTAGQEMALDLSVLRGYSASHTGGTALTPFTTTNQQKQAGKVTANVTLGGMPPSQMADMRIGTTGALTAGTHVFDPQPIARESYAELAAAATVAPGRMQMECLNQDTVIDYPIVLQPNEGLCVRNVVLMGAAGTGRLIVEVDWLELSRY